jgi:hypothetical protein
MPLSSALPSTSAALSTASVARSVAAHRRSTVAASGDADFALFCARVHSYCWVELVLQSRGGANKLSPSFVGDVLREQGIADTPSARQDFSRELSTEGKWRRFSDKFGLGILALLPLQSGHPYHISPSALRKMSKDDMEAFDHYAQAEPANHALLMSLCRTGAGLVSRVIRGAHAAFGVVDPLDHEADFEYQAEWEDGVTPTPDDIDPTGLGTLLRALAVKSYLPRNLPAQQGMVWRIPGWPAHYPAPADPLLILHPSTPCSDLLHGCAEHVPVFTLPPRISANHRLSSSCLRAVVLASKDALLGELVGEMHPVEHSDCRGMFCVVRRDDMYLAGLAVCHLHWQHRGNWARLIPHSCHPTVAFRRDMSTCRVRMGIFALADMAVEEEISADWTALEGNVAEKLQKCLWCKGPCTRPARTP